MSLVGVLCFVLVLIFSTLCPSSKINHIDVEEKSGCFSLFVFLMLYGMHSLLFYLMVLLVGLQRVIVLFPDHTHLLF